MTDCPPPETLEDLLRGGETPDPAMDLWAHVVDCGRCQETLDRLTDSDLMEPWRHRARGVLAKTEDEPGLSRLLDRLRADSGETSLGSGDSGGTSSAPHGLLGP